MDTTKKQKIAIVGSGIAGLTAGYFLSQKYEVTIFEAQPTLGLDAHSMSVAGARVDAPLRTFNRAHYRNLTALYDLLNIDYGLANYCFSAVDLDLQSMFFRYYNFLLGKRSISYPWPFTRESWGKKYFQILRDFVRFWVYGRRDINNGALTGLTFGEYLQHRGFSRVFIQGVLFPMLCVVCTCSFDGLASYPAEVIVTYLLAKSDKPTSQLRVLDGAKEVVSRLAAPISTVRTSTAVVSVEPKAGSVEITYRKVDDASEAVAKEVFQHVIIATQANMVPKVLRGVDKALLSALSNIPHQAGRVVIHKDKRLLPSKAPIACCMPNNASWSTVNLSLSSKFNAPMCTVWMNGVDKRLKMSLKEDVFQTWNPLIEPEPRHVVRDSWFERPLVTLDSAAHLKTLYDHQGKDGIWFCGAYTIYSIPLLENAVNSALATSERLGVSVPWDWGRALSLLPLHTASGTVPKPEEQHEWVGNWPGRIAPRSRMKSIAVALQTMLLILAIGILSVVIFGFDALSWLVGHCRRGTAQGKVPPAWESEKISSAAENQLLPKAPGFPWPHPVEKSSDYNPAFFATE